MSILVFKHLRNSQNATIFGNRLFKELGYNEHTQAGPCNRTSVLLDTDIHKQDHEKTQEQTGHLQASEKTQSQTCDYQYSDTRSSDCPLGQPCQIMWWLYRQRKNWDAFKELTAEQ